MHALTTAPRVPQIERATHQGLEGRLREMQGQRDAAEAERSTLQEEAAAAAARSLLIEVRARDGSSADGSPMTLDDT